MKLQRVLAAAVAAVATTSTATATAMTMADASHHPRRPVAASPAPSAPLSAATGLFTSRVTPAPAPPVTSSPALPASPSTAGPAPVRFRAAAPNRQPAPEPLARPAPTSSSAPRPAPQSVGLPTPSHVLPSLPPDPPVRQVDAVVRLPGPITASEAHALVHTAGISAIEEVDTGTVSLSGRPAVTFGVDPATFREFTPAVTATDTRLWQYVAAGSLASSYEMATDRKLPLGGRLRIVPAGAKSPATSGWLGAFVSLGIPGVDMVVSHNYSKVLGLTPDSGLIVSAPGLNGYQLQQTLASELPGANIDLTDPNMVTVTAPATSRFIPAPALTKVITAALSRVGDPYVWGGDGPTGFDCSGLVGWAFAQAGIAMPRTAAQQFLAGPQIPLADIAPGDLLFWAYDPSDPGFIDHVAMYIGNGQMVVAPHTGTDVQIDPVYTADLVGAVRVDPAMAAQVGGPQFP
jgi:hypothetical protein